MKLKRIIGSVAAIVAVTAAVVLYTVHPVKSSDHQDTYNLATAVGHNPSADITDVFVFPAPDDPADNVVFAMDTYPLITPTGTPSKFFDPTILWQFKISHQASGVEDEVIQFTADAINSPSQQLALYGPAAPNQVGTTNTPVKLTGLFPYNSATALGTTGIKVFAGPRADPFVFDLFAFFSFLGDRNAQTHTGQNDPGAGNAFSNGDTVGVAQQLSPSYDQTAGRATAPTFNGFAPGTMSSTVNTASAYACSTNPATNVLLGFNVLSFVVEVPKALLTTGYPSGLIHVWATASSNTTNS